MRTKRSLVNSVVGCLSYAIIMIGAFATRTFFVKMKGMELSGIEGTFLNVASNLAIVEMGIGIGIVYKLYKPIADKDWDQISIILCFLRKFYIIISAVILGIGLASSYFAVSRIKGEFSKFWLAEIFMLYVLDVVASYLYSHKRSMFIADQKNYVNNVIHTIAQVLMFVFQIAVLKIFNSFELYIICRIASKVVENLIISYRFDKKYSFINLKNKATLPAIEKKELFNNTKALFVHKISSSGTTIATALIILNFGLRENGIYDKYMLIVTSLMALTNEIFNGILASFGNLLNTGSRKKAYDNFNVLYFINFLMYSFIVSSFVSIITPFIGLWMGSDFTFGIITMISIAGYLYVYGIRQSIGMAKVSAGIYDPDKYMALIGALITIIMSIILVKPFGVTGVMIGNMVGIMAVPYWVQPYIVYNDVFNKSVKSYHQKFAIYTGLTVLYSAVCYAFGMLASKIGVISGISNGLRFITGKFFAISSGTPILISQVIFNMIICLIIPNVLNIIIFYRTKEFQDLLGTAKGFLRKAKKQ